MYMWKQDICGRDVVKVIIPKNQARKQENKRKQTKGTGKYIYKIVCK